MATDYLDDGGSYNRYRQAPRSRMQMTWSGSTIAVLPFLCTWIEKMNWSWLPTVIIPVLICIWPVFSANDMDGYGCAPVHLEHLHWPTFAQPPFQCQHPHSFLGASVLFHVHECCRRAAPACAMLGSSRCGAVMLAHHHCRHCYRRHDYSRIHSDPAGLDSVVLVYISANSWINQYI